MLDLVIVLAGGLVVGLALGRGGRLDFFGLPVSVRGLYTPILLLTAAGHGARVLLPAARTCRALTLPDPRSLRRRRGRPAGRRRRAVASALRRVAAGVRRHLGLAADLLAQQPARRGPAGVRHAESVAPARWCGSSDRPQLAAPIGVRRVHRERSAWSRWRSSSSPVAAAAPRARGWVTLAAGLRDAGARPVRARRRREHLHPGTVGAAALRAGLRHDPHADAVRDRGGAGAERAVRAGPGRSCGRR